MKAFKTAYMVMSRDQKSKRSHNVKCDNISFGSVKGFKLFETLLKYINSIQEYCMSRGKLGKVFYLSDQNFCLPGFLYKNIQLKTFRNI